MSYSKWSDKVKNNIVKKCSCGRTFTETEWQRLKYVGVQEVPPDMGRPLELRNCLCDSTLSRPIDVVRSK